MFKKNATNIILVIIALIFIKKFGCPFKRFLNLICPTCGMTRAIISILQLDLKQYCYYNIMALPVLLSGISILIKCKVKAFIIIAYIILTINIFYYLYRIIILHIDI